MIPDPQPPISNSQFPIPDSRFPGDLRIPCIVAEGVANRFENQIEHLGNRRKEQTLPYKLGEIDSIQVLSK